MREFHSIPDYSAKTLNKRSCFCNVQNFILSYRSFENLTLKEKFLHEF